MKKVKQYGKWWGLLLCIGVGFGLDKMDASQLRSSLEMKVIPVTNKVGQPLVDITQSAKALRTWQDKTRSLVQMRQELGADLSRLNELDTLTAENKSLRSALNLVENQVFSDRDLLLARPLVSYAQPTVTIGRDDGVRVGMLVSSLDRVWLGRISQVSARISQVELLTRSSSSPVLAQVNDSTQGLVKGRGDSLIFTDLPREMEIKVGQKVVAVGQPGVPAGELIGIISRIETLPTDAVHTASIDQLQDFYQVSMVAVYD